jgi:Leucine-rich repeat (LRR) protein
MVRKRTAKTVNLALLALCVCLFLSIWTGSYLYAAIPDEEREALIAFYNATEGDNWYDNSGWKTDPLEVDGFAPKGTENKWKGVTVRSGRVVKLEFVRNGLSGSLPEAVGTFTELESLRLMEPDISGELPPALGKLVKLRRMSLTGDYTSSLPGELGDLANLEMLYLVGDFSGSPPTKLGNLTKLKSLELRGSFDGDIPAELGEMEQLESLTLAGDLSGSVPPELGNLTRLKKLSLGYYVHFSSQKGGRKSINFDRTAGSELSGQIPPDLGKLANLEELHIAGQLSGEIPPELGNLTRLKQLSLNNNMLEGEIPPELGNLSQLEALELANNQLSGSIPSELGKLASLKILWLNGNQLSDSIPMELANLSKLEQLRLEGNQLSGEIPADLAGMSTYIFNIGYNRLYTNEDSLQQFLNRMDLSWKRTQTIAPVNVRAVPASSTSVTVSWKPILFKSGAGSYLVYYSDSPGGEWRLGGTTGGKSASSFVVEKLRDGRTYYFVVQTRTYPHPGNTSTLTSEYSVETSATTPSRNP